MCVCVCVFIFPILCECTVQEAERARQAALALAAEKERLRKEREAALAAAKAKEEAERRARENEAAAAAAAAIVSGGSGAPTGTASTGSGTTDAHALSVLKKVDEIVAACKASKTQYTDKWTGAAALGKKESEYQVGAWQRFPALGPDTAVVRDGYAPGDICQGSLGDCYFLSALSVLACHPAMLDQVILTKEVNPVGVYAIRMWKNGRWAEVIVDDTLPVSTTAYYDTEDKTVYSGKPSVAEKKWFVPKFVTARTRTEFWYV